MPQGNHHVVPSGLWWLTPTTTSVPKLLLKSFRNLTLFSLGVWAIHEYRALSWKYTFSNFVGRSIVYRTNTTATHDPLSVEEIDKLRAEMIEKRLKKHGMKQNE